MRQVPRQNRFSATARPDDDDTLRRAKGLCHGAPTGDAKTGDRLAGELVAARAIEG